LSNVSLWHIGQAVNFPAFICDTSQEHSLWDACRGTLLGVAVH
jgi:hypothetical protein